jgi:hypothetical protein
MLIMLQELFFPSQGSCSHFFDFFHPRNCSTCYRAPRATSTDGCCRDIPPLSPISSPRHGVACWVKMYLGSDWKNPAGFIDSNRDKNYYNYR